MPLQYDCEDELFMHTLLLCLLLQSHAFSIYQLLHEQLSPLSLRILPQRPASDKMETPYTRGKLPERAFCSEKILVVFPE